MANKRKTELHLAVDNQHGESVVPRLADIQGILTDVPQSKRETVLNETKEFYKARAQAGAGYLAMGDHLSKIREVLEPMEKWKAFINLIPNISQATAYRMIWAYENVQRALPGVTRAVAVRDGYKLISWKKGETFAPGYDEAVREVTKTIGPAPEQDEAKAGEWLQAVMQKKRTIRSTRQKVTSVTIESQEAKILRTIERTVKGLTEAEKAEFGLRVSGMVLSLCHSPKYRIKPLPIPEHYLKHKAA